jgi:hypothetical protein
MRNCPKGGPDARAIVEGCDPRAPKPGDWFLLPFAGPERTRVIQAVRPAAMGGGQWTVRSGRTGRIQAGYTLLSSCHPLTAKRANEILFPTNGS